MNIPTCCFTILCLIPCLVGCSSAKQRSNNYDDWQLASQAQSSLLNNGRIESRCKLNPDRELSTSTIRIFLLMKKNNLLTSEIIEDDRREIILKDNQHVVKLLVKSDVQGCSTFDLWQILQ
jgi:hypothetical protein